MRDRIHENIAVALLKIAAKRSTETQFGWAHPDCDVLVMAARIVRGEPERTQPDERVDGVLSDAIALRDWHKSI